MGTLSIQGCDLYFGRLTPAAVENRLKKAKDRPHGDLLRVNCKIPSTGHGRLEQEVSRGGSKNGSPKVILIPASN